MMRPNPIELEGVTKEYLEETALWNVSLAVGEGESVGLIGSNGAGKTTLLNIVMGFLPYEEGVVSVLGASPPPLPAAVRARIGFVPEDSGLPPWAKVRDLASLHRALYPAWDDERLEAFASEWEIPTGRRLLALSKGQRRLAELALCFSARPDLLLLDEPFVGLDAVMRLRVSETIRSLNRESGATVLYSSHILSDIERIAERVVIIREGEIGLDEKIESIGVSVEEAFIAEYGLGAAADSPPREPR